MKIHLHRSIKILQILTLGIIHKCLYIRHLEAKLRIYQGIFSHVIHVCITAPHFDRAFLF